jgi:hypothetical protein
MSNVTCRWCMKSCPPAKAGKPKRYCSEACKRAFEQAIRAQSLLQLSDGKLSIEELRQARSRWRRIHSSDVSPRMDHKHDV